MQQSLLGVYMSDLQDFGFGTQIRKSPYFDATVKWGAQGFSVYNHMYIPRDFGSPEENFWNLINHAILCDVAVERQVQITGPDAAAFVQYLTPRDLSKLAVGQCKYILITNQQGGIINDPVLLRLEEQTFWISLADSDVLLWAQGVAVNALTATPCAHNSTSLSARDIQNVCSSRRSKTGSLIMPPCWLVIRIYLHCPTANFDKSRGVKYCTKAAASGPVICTCRSTATSHKIA